MSDNEESGDSVNMKMSHPLVFILMQAASLTGILMMAFNAGGFKNDMDHLKVKFDKQDVVLTTIQKDLNAIKNQVSLNTNSSATLSMNSDRYAKELREIKNDVGDIQRCLIAIKKRREDISCDKIMER